MTPFDTKKFKRSADKHFVLPKHFRIEPWKITKVFTSQDPWYYLVHVLLVWGHIPQFYCDATVMLYRVFFQRCRWLQEKTNDFVPSKEQRASSAVCGFALGFDAYEGLNSRFGFDGLKCDDDFEFCFDSVSLAQALVLQHEVLAVFWVSSR